MKENNENKAKALEENNKNYSSENSTPQNGEDIISNEEVTIYSEFLVLALFR